jgi:hypothetical protein
MIVTQLVEFQFFTGAAGVTGGVTDTDLLSWLNYGLPWWSTLPLPSGTLVTNYVTERDGDQVTDRDGDDVYFQEYSVSSASRKHFLHLYSGTIDMQLNWIGAVAIAVYQPGADACEVFSPGPAASQVFQPGAVACEVRS